MNNKRDGSRTMDKVMKNTIQEITRLHSEIAGHMRMSLEKAIRIGELLREQKSKQKHGSFTSWVVNNVPFTHRTAQMYMKLYNSRDKLKNESVSLLKDAYQLLSGTKQIEDKEEHEPMGLTDLTQDQLTYIVENLNVLIGDKKYSIRTDFDYFIIDGAPLPYDENQTLALAWNLMSHFCYYTQFAWKNGIGALPAGIRQYLIEFENDQPGTLLREPEPLCGNCPAMFEPEAT
jgi:hypothetical protein